MGSNIKPRTVSLFTMDANEGKILYTDKNIWIFNYSTKHMATLDANSQQK